MNVSEANEEVPSILPAGTSKPSTPVRKEIY